MPPAACKVLGAWFSSSHVQNASSRCKSHPVDLNEEGDSMKRYLGWMHPTVVVRCWPSLWMQKSFASTGHNVLNVICHCDNSLNILTGRWRLSTYMRGRAVMVPVIRDGIVLRYSSLKEWVADRAFSTHFELPRTYWEGSAANSYPHAGRPLDSSGAVPWMVQGKHNWPQASFQDSSAAG